MLWIGPSLCSQAPDPAPPCPSLSLTPRPVSQFYMWKEGAHAGLRRWAFLTRALHENRWYHEIFIMARKLLLVFTGVFVADNYLQVGAGRGRGQ